MIDVEIDDKVLEGGRRGKALVFGYGLIDVYYKDEDKTWDPLNSEGGFHTVDIASIYANSMIMFRSRLKEMLLVKNE